MWEWALRWSEVRDDLVLGSSPMTVDDIENIREQTGATALLSLQSDACRAHYNIDFADHRDFGERRQIAMVNAPMYDFDASEQRRSLPYAVRSLRDLLCAGHKTYVHCTSGYSRAPLAALGYLTFVEKETTENATATILAAQPEADPSWEAYHGCRADLVDLLRENILVRAYYLSQEEPEASPAEHWARAECDMICSAFINGGTAPRWRLDPCRA
ncbi:MAG: dual specificity protein phosphatase family protein [Rhodospirillales bacterium]|nr:dual specificity protein phosphatase family protein [Rhodospirillales bacterium]